MKYHYRILVQRDEIGMFTAECPALPGCVSQGATIKEAIANYAKTMRLFTTIQISDEVRRHLRQRCGQLNLNKTINPQNFHITLNFLGEIEEGRVPAICDALKEIQTAGTATLRVDALECFPPRGPVRVVAFGLGGDVGLIRQLHDQISAACEQFGCERERRAYRPHITVSRHRKPLHPVTRDDMENEVAPHLPGPVFMATEFVLMQSLLKPEGAQYIPVARFPL
jgi:RNA 2',3'-cyclic 3'-phosphodiesterase